MLALLLLGIWLWQQNAQQSEAGGPATELLAALSVQQEDSGAHYDRQQWGDWASQGKSCDTRETVLQRQGRDVQSGASCKIISGTWTSAYDGVTVTEPRTLDIDHIVPVKEANRSGARDWSAEQRRAFYNDFDNLVAVSASSNRGKGDSDPGHWRPDRGHWCDYATGYVRIKTKYHLSVDDQEHAALVQMLNTCPA